MIRESISKRIRFDVFKRDFFTCQYCGNTPPSTVLEIDHVHPVSKGGSNSINNLITACFDCNRGKSNNLLTSIPDSIVEKLEAIKEKESQIRAFNALIKKVNKREDSYVAIIESSFNEAYGDHSFNIELRASIKKIFISSIPIDNLREYMLLACEKTDNPESCVRYFCGICWNKIRDKK